MASNTMRSYRRRQAKRKKMGRERRREMKKNPPRTLPLDEAPSGAEIKARGKN